MSDRHLAKACFLGLGWASVVFILTPVVLGVIACGEDDACLDAINPFTVKMLVLCLAVSAAVFGFVSYVCLSGPNDE